jgi:hypothetical protein
MNTQKIITSLAVFSLVVILPLSSFLFGSHRVLAQVCVDGAGYYDGSGMWCSSQDGSDSSCTYESCPVSPGGGGTNTGTIPPGSGTNTGTNPPPSTGTGLITIPNPLKSGNSNTLYGFISDLINGVVVPIGGVLAVLYIMYAGFLMVTARGSEEQIKKGRAAFTHAAIGTAILLGAWVIATVIENTIKSLTG